MSAMVGISLSLKTSGKEDLQTSDSLPAVENIALFVCAVLFVKDCRAEITSQDR
jgi:hypothetical protein